MGISSDIMRVQYLALTIFSVRGGIEQVSKNWIYVLNQLNLDYSIKVYALYDSAADEKYISTFKFKGYNKNKLAFIIASVLKGIFSDVSIFSHIHLSVIAVLIKFFNPVSKIIFQLHGIEIWRDLSFVQKLALKFSTQIICVSEFTRSKLLEKYPNLSHKSIVLNNSIDPYIIQGFDKNIRESYRRKLSLLDNNRLIISVGRLNNSEAYKGYDKVIEAIAELKDSNIVYHIIGKYDDIELNRINALIRNCNMESQVKILGYVDDDNLNAYLNAADVFAMPSKGEGFGIVYIEAMLRGLRVIAGNKDGSVDAVKHFNVSKLVDPDSKTEISIAISDLLISTFTESDRYELSNKCRSLFGSNIFNNKIINLLHQWK